MIELKNDDNDDIDNNDDELLRKIFENEINDYDKNNNLKICQINENDLINFIMNKENNIDIDVIKEFYKLIFIECDKYVKKKKKN